MLGLEGSLALISCRGSEQRAGVGIAQGACLPCGHLSTAIVGVSSEGRSETLRVSVEMTPSGNAWRMQPWCPSFWGGKISEGLA